MGVLVTSSVTKNGSSISRRYPAHRRRADEPRFEEALVAQETQRAQHRVGVDSEHRREVPRLWDALAGRGFAVGDRAADFGRDLLVEEHRVTAIDG